MTFDEILEQAIEMLRRRGRLTYRALKRQFDLDDEYLDDLKEALIYAHPQVVDDGQGLIWPAETSSTSETIPSPASAPASPPAADQEPPPISYTPQHLTEKILTSRSALEGERKQVTVCFADIKDSTELIKDLDPEDAQKLLDPAQHSRPDPDYIHAAVPPTVRASIRSVGWPTPTGTPWPSLPQVPMPLSNAMSW